MSEKLKVFVVGNIGAGKTTLCCRLKQSLPNAAVSEEPVSKIENLGDYYAEMAANPNAPNKFAYPLLMEFLEHRFQNELRAEGSAERLVVMERCMFEDRYVFAEAMRVEGTISAERFADFHCEFETRIAKVAKPILFVYLRASTPTLLHRIQIRGRECEKDIKAEYLNLLTANYETFFQNLEANAPGARVAIIETDTLSSEEVLTAAMQHLHQHSIIAA